MNELPSQPLSRRQLLKHASHSTLAIGAASALASGPLVAQETKPSAAQAGTATTNMFTDFERSCVRFRMDTTKKPPKTVSQKLPMTLNNVRMILDARVVITHKPTGRVDDLVLSSSCKSEQVWVDRGVWHQPNADMCMLAGRSEFVVFKRWDKTDKGVMLFPPSLGVQPERQLGNPAEAFDGFSIDLAQRSGRVLENIDAILEALFANSPVISQTEYEQGDYAVLLEYPIKVVNFSERERYYQVDTGPILLPDFDNPAPSMLERCRLAYVAHNVPDWAEFIVCVPTPLSEAIKVHHYSQSLRIDGTRNRLIAML